MIKANKPYLGLLVAIGLMGSGCTSLSTERVNQEQAGFSAEQPSIGVRPGRFTAEMKEELIVGESTYSRSLGILITGDYPGIISSLRAFNLTKPSISTTHAAAKAVDSVKADGIYVTDIREEASGFFPFFYTVKVTVRGKPVYFKALGPLPVEKSDFSEVSKIEALDDEIAILKAHIEKELGKPIKLSEYKNSGYNSRDSNDESPKERKTK